MGGHVPDFFVSEMLEPPSNRENGFLSTPKRSCDLMYMLNEFCRTGNFQPVEVLTVRGSCIAH